MKNRVRSVGIMTRAIYSVHFLILSGYLRTYGRLLIFFLFVWFSFLSVTLSRLSIYIRHLPRSVTCRCA